MMRLKRGSLDAALRESYGRLIAGRLSALPAYRSANAVMFYATHGSEVPTEEMMEQAWRDGKTVALPCTDGSTGAITAAAVTCWRKDLLPGTFGVREPDATCCRPLRSEEIDLVIVPGLAFDLNGNRLGYGKGCYDRWLTAFPQDRRVALAFDFQVLRDLPAEGHDLPVGLIVTERRLIHTVTMLNRKELTE